MEILSIIFGAALFILIVYLAIKWLAFPVEMSKRMDALIAETKRTNEILESRRSENETRVIEMPPPASGHKQDNKT